MLTLCIVWITCLIGESARVDAYRAIRRIAVGCERNRSEVDMVEGES
jgi:hypothetical protein